VPRMCASSPARRPTDPELANALAALADVYVNDAFGAAHRSMQSTRGVGPDAPVCGRTALEGEVSTLSAILESPSDRLWRHRGSQGGDKIGVIDRFLALATW